MKPYKHDEPRLDLSVVVPIYNERDNVGPLARDIVRELDKLNRSYEVILVNDGSADGSTEELDAAAAAHEHVKVLHFARNRGQTIAIAAGMYHSVGKVIVLMDGDRQNDPSDIGALVSRLAEGFDCVSGWRKDRQDSGIRKLPSRCANWLINRITGVPIHDLGCTLKAYKRHALDPTELFGEMHRFLAVYVQGRGGSIAEMVVKHHPRTAGEAKYGMGRIPRVVADIFLIRILLKYSTRPSHLFAKVGQYFFVAGAFFALWWILKTLWYWSLSIAALSFFTSITLFCTAVVVLSCGLVAELVVRNRYTLTDSHPWEIARTAGFE